MRPDALNIEHSEVSAITEGRRQMLSLQNAILDYENNNKSRLIINKYLDRKLVSFQANKTAPIYRLFKYKEGFSAAIVEYFIDYLKVDSAILDPFSGTGTTNIVAAIKSLPSTGVEILPVGNLAAKTRAIILQGLSHSTVEALNAWKNDKIWERCSDPDELVIMRITQGAYPKDTEFKIRQFIGEASKQDEEIKTVLMFSLCAVLESMSYTRKDGQYLRWDHRSGRRVGKRPFDKGVIYSFDEAIESKLSDILEDLEQINRPTLFGASEKPIVMPEFYVDSSLSFLQHLPNECFSAVITSPPYCNRYDYTRTYALELAALGVVEKELLNMRQAMLSSTVENREKDLLSINSAWKSIIQYTNNHKILSKIRSYLWRLRASGELNNNGIPRMIEGYFNEMSCIIHECYRTLSKGGSVAMVNDNVRYAGIAVPVDLILSDIAEACGFIVDRVMVLPTGKGNSSQQMGEHGRSPLRKCVYVWRKP